MLRTRLSALQSCSVLLSSDRGLSKFPLAGSRSRRIPSECTWSFMSATAECRSIYQVSNSAPGKDVSSRFPEVIYPSDLLKYPEEETLTQISITGNYYSFANAYQSDARLFFTQGCVPTEAEKAEKADNSASTASKPAASEQESSAEKSQTKGKGRGKSKASENKR